MAGASFPVYVETGAKRAFACAVEWPGWCRSGRDEASALQALVDSAPRYARVAARSGLRFVRPASVSDVRVVERVGGDASTDFGVPGAKPKADGGAVDDADIVRLRALITAAWQALDDAAAQARGRTLAKGPRGGGRSRDAIVRHVREAEAGYLTALGWKFTPQARGERARLEETRAAVLEGLAASARGEIPAKGPRGGVRWRPRYFARRLAWHALDHAWEIEDRAR
jgi:hypothetical protein